MVNVSKSEKHLKGTIDFGAKDVFRGDMCTLQGDTKASNFFLNINISLDLPKFTSESTVLVPTQATHPHPSAASTSFNTTLRNKSPSYSKFYVLAITSYTITVPGIIGNYLCTLINSDLSWTHSLLSKRHLCEALEGRLVSRIELIFGSANPKRSRPTIPVSQTIFYFFCETLLTIWVAGWKEVIL